MRVLKTLTQKIIFTSILLLFFLSLFISLLFYFTRHIRNEAVRINLVSQLKYRSYEMAWLAGRIVEREAEVIHPALRESYMSGLKDHITAFDQIVRDIKLGNREKGLQPLAYHEILPKLDSVLSVWKEHQRPLLLHVSGLPKDFPEKQARELLSRYDAGIADYVNEVDRIAYFLENNYEDEIEKFYLLMLAILGFFSIATVLIFGYMRHSVVRPIRSLRDSAKEIESGNFAVNVSVKSSDEVGELSRTFNTMSATLAQLFAEAEKRANDILSLNIASNKILGITDTKLLYETICENMLKLYDLKLVWFGLVEDGSFEVKPVAHAGDRYDYLSDITVTWDNAPTGMGPVGMAIKTKSLRLITFVNEDSSFKPWIEIARKSGFQSVLAAPLICSGNEVIGAIALYSDNPACFNAETVEMIQIFVNHAAAVIDNIGIIEALEKTVRRRTRELEDAKLIAESASMSKANFLANMSHELRTPLNVIIGFSEALVSGIYGEIKSEHAEYISHILRSGIQLLSLVNSIMELTTIDTGTMTLDYTECSIKDIVYSSAEMFKEKAKKHRIGLHLEIGEDLFTFVIDENKVKFILFNLLANALKATPDSGMVCLSVRKAGDKWLKKAVHAEGPGRQLFLESPKIEDFLEIMVDDSGPTMPAEESENLFRPFLQAESPLTDAKEGLRIGLALCKRFVEVHGGDIWIESLPVGERATEESTQGCAQKTGNRFIFALPRRPLKEKFISIQTAQNG